VIASVAASDAARVQIDNLSLRDAMIELWFMGATLSERSIAKSARKSGAIEGDRPVGHRIVSHMLSCFRVAYFGNCAQSGRYTPAKTKYGVSTDSEEVL
jgi:hypothetical protein